MFCENTVTVARDLGKQVQAKLTTKGRYVFTSGAGDWIHLNGRTVSHYIQIAGGGLETILLAFKSRKEQCDYLREILSRNA